MDLLAKLDKRTRKHVENFHNAHMHDEKVDELTEMKWTAEAMELVGTSNRLKPQEKKQLVVALHGDLAAQPTNGFRGSFNIGGAIEFVWDTDHQRYGIRVHKKGCCAKYLTCFKSCACVYDVDDNQLHLDAESLPPVPPSTPQLPTANEIVNSGNTHVTQIATETNTTTTSTTTTTDDDVEVHVTGNVDGDVVVNLNVEKEK